MATKEDRRAAAVRHAEGLEKKLQHAQEEARAYLKTLEGSSEKHKEQHAGSRFTCFTGTKSTGTDAGGAAVKEDALRKAGLEFTCFTGTKVPLLTQEALQSKRTHCARPGQSCSSYSA